MKSHECVAVSHFASGLDSNDDDTIILYYAPTDYCGDTISHSRGVNYFANERKVMLSLGDVGAVTTHKTMDRSLN